MGAFFTQRDAGVKTRGWKASSWDLDPGFFLLCLLLYDPGSQPLRVEGVGSIFSPFLRHRGSGTRVCMALIGPFPRRGSWARRGGEPHPCPSREAQHQAQGQIKVGRKHRGPRARWGQDWGLAPPVGTPGPSSFWQWTLSLPEPAPGTPQRPHQARSCSPRPRVC